MKFIIRKATEADFAAILSLIKELAVFQGMPEKVTNTAELMRAEKSLFGCYIAEDEAKEIVGMACYFFAYFTWVGKSLYLDDLYVKQSVRGQKIGYQLLKHIFEVARQENCKRVRWQVSEWNKKAIAFYKKCGADIHGEEYNCDFDEKAIRDFKG